MFKEIRLGVITDGTPVSEEVLASGMLRVNTRLFRALSENIDFIATTNYGNTFSYPDIAEDLRDRTTLVAFPKKLSILFKALGRFSPRLKHENAAFEFLLPGLLKRLRSSQINWLFCPCGVDPLALERGFRLAQASGLPLAVYLVDDFLSGAILSGNKQHLQIVEHQIPQWLDKIDKIFVISEGLRDRLKKLYNVDSVVLPLPYELPENSVKNVSHKYKEQLIFVGSVSHFYRDGLRQLASVLDNINKENNRNLILRLTSSNIKTARNLIGDFKCIKCEPCSTSEELYKEIASSMLCFAPYSFDKKYEVMISTSFPSKMLDYLAAGKYIVIYSPDNSSSVSYFKKNKLPEFITTDNPDALRQIIIKQLNEQQNYSIQYRLSLQNNHSYNSIYNLVLNHLSNSHTISKI